MNSLINLLVIWTITTFYTIEKYGNGNVLYSFLAMIVITGLFLLRGKKELYKYIVLAIFLGLGLYNYTIFYFLPCISYFFLFENNLENAVIIFVNLSVLSLKNAHMDLIVYCLAATTIVVVVKRLEINNRELEDKYRNHVIESRKKELDMGSYNRKLIEEQNRGIEIAILNERNRISRDIHDGVGHIISRGILQIGAIYFTEKDENLKENIMEVKKTLYESMANLRKSLHNLQEESMILETELSKLVNDFSFCKVNYSYSIDEKDKDMNFKYSILYIVKESLNNIVKHSNATIVDIVLKETKDKVFLLIKDNGENCKISKYGIGLNSMESRVRSINGNMEIYTNNGFRIFITISKVNK